MNAVGIESLAFHTSAYYLPLATLAETRGVSPDKYRLGLGQDQMAVPPPDEDVVTLGTSAAARALAHVDSDELDWLLFATESGIDQSKAAGLYVHRLLELPAACRVMELKQACYSGTGALQLAAAWVQQNPGRKVLIVAADIARYGLFTPGEPTQGCGAVAMVVSQQPTVLALESGSGAYAQDIMDFWRPNYRDEALVDGQFSTRMYIQTLVEAWRDYTRRTGRSLESHDRFCYHLPFTRLAGKAHSRLVHAVSAPLTSAEANHQIADSLHYNRQCGNSYTASLYIGLCSLLDHSALDLSDKRIGFFSYGSGCVAEVFSGRVAPEYKQALHTQAHQTLLQERQELTYDEYVEFYQHRLPQDGGLHRLPQFRTGPYRLAGTQQHQRIYEVRDDYRAGPG